MGSHFTKIKKWLLKRLVVQPKNIHQARKNNTTIVTLGTVIVSLLLTCLLLNSYFTNENYHVLPQLTFASIALIYTIIIFIIIRKYPIFSGWMLIALYFLIAFYILINWGINSPIGILLLGFIIFLTNITLGSRSTLVVCFVAITSLLALQLLSSYQIITPDTSTFDQPATISDAISYMVIFGIFGVTSWVSSRITEKSLQRALKAEADVKREKRLLTVRLEDQAQKLKKAQLTEMSQLYQFAELGQLTSSMFHELANHLSIISLDIQSVANKKLASQLYESLKEVDVMIANVRKRLNTTYQSESFSLDTCIKDTIKDVKITRKTRHANIDINYYSSIKKGVDLSNGDPLRFSQALTILLNNAIDAINLNNNALSRVVDITIDMSPSEHVIIINDTGPGIHQSRVKNLFKPQKSSKEKGLGIGLYIANQFIENHFGGKIRFDSKYKNGARFTIHLPRI